MKIFQTFEAVPSRLIGLLNVLRRQPESWADRAVILELLQPRPIRNTQDAAAMIEVIGAAVELGIVFEDRGDRSAPKLRLAPEFLGEDDQDFDARLPRLLARVALASTCQGRANQFTRACAWLLLQSPIAMPQGHNEMKQRVEADALNLDELGLRNDQRWDMLIYWSTYFGLTWQMTKRKCFGVIPDPSTYILRHLNDILPDEQRVPVQQFRERLGALCPALDGGDVHREIAATVASGRPLNARSEERLSASLTFALRHLRAIDAVEYWCPDDQRTFLLMSDDEKIAFVRRGRGVEA